MLSLNYMRQKSLTLLEKFIDNGLSSYSSKRNYDFGEKNRSNVSLLSPYIRKRIVHEKEAILKCLKEFSYSKIEKFIQEIFWRSYWKGWLEGREILWKEYKKKTADHKSDLIGFKKKNYLKAVDGNTGINCFDSWVSELKNTGYMHNHARMWFASIWVHTLKLPWELGADFFLTHLLDGDPASNTLSWRWVAGLHTQGKNYLASEENIIKFTNGRFKKQNLLTRKANISQFISYEFKSKNFDNSNFPNKDDFFLINVNQLCYSENSLSLMQNCKVCLINQYTEYELSIEPKKFNKKAIESYKNYLIEKNIKIQEFKDFEDFKSLIKNEKIKTVFSFYPAIGYELDFLKKSADNYNFNLEFIFDEYDRLCWPHSRAGFFKLKSKIPFLIEKISEN